MLTVLTLGLYRFWMKTRLRRYYWSAVRIGGHPLEYVGDPVEKLLGFLVAVVILAFYIGIVNLVFMFASFAVFEGPAAAYGLSLLGVVPLWFYARYRARRYVLARTRWRGLRFGLEPGAWGYAARAVWHWLLTLLTLGLLWPRMTFKLEKYRTDRTFYGTERMAQGGRWTMLYGATKPIFAALALAVLSAAVGWQGAAGPAAGVGLLAGMTLAYGLVHYRVETLRRLTEAKTLGGVGFAFAPSPRRVFLIVALGYAAALACIVALLMVAGLATAALLGLTLGEFEVSTEDIPALSGALRWAATAGALAVYFAAFLLWSTLTHVFVTLPVFRHYAERLELSGTGALAAIRQRPRDEAPQAEGFAEALDVGASL